MAELLDNRAHRIRTLKSVFRELHNGVGVEDSKKRLHELIRVCDATEIAQAEQELISEGMPMDQLKSMCDAHAQVAGSMIPKHAQASMEGLGHLIPGHPARTFVLENDAIDAHLVSLGGVINEICTSIGKVDHGLVIRARTLMNELMDLENHYQRKEHLLFSMLERHQIHGPSNVMWAKDDDVREKLNALHGAMSVDGFGVDDWKKLSVDFARPAFEGIKGIIFKENTILIPMAMSTLTPMEWGEVWMGSPQIGWCLVDPEEGYVPPQDQERSGRVPMGIEAKGEGGSQPVSIDLLSSGPTRTPPLPGAIMFPTGSLTLDQLIEIFSVLPVDLTFVDTDDRVRFFSEGPDRVFIRPKAVIGRKVQHCHPPGSVHIVDQILNDFRSGDQTIADFWIEFQEKFVHIRYIAIRDEQGSYMGTLEITQDATDLRGLKGEQRLLSYEPSK